MRSLMLRFHYGRHLAGGLFSGFNDLRQTNSSGTFQLSTQGHFASSGSLLHSISISSIVLLFFCAQQAQLKSALLLAGYETLDQLGSTKGQAFQRLSGLALGTERLQNHNTHMLFHFRPRSKPPRGLYTSYLTLTTRGYTFNNCSFCRSQLNTLESWGGFIPHAAELHPITLKTVHFSSELFRSVNTPGFVPEFSKPVSIKLQLVQQCNHLGKWLFLCISTSVYLLLLYYVQQKNRNYSTL